MKKNLKPAFALIIVFSVFMTLSFTVFALSRTFYVSGGACNAQVSRSESGASAYTAGAMSDYYCYTSLKLYFQCPRGYDDRTQSRGAYGESYVSISTPCGTGSREAQSHHRADAPNGQSDSVDLIE